MAQRNKQPPKKSIRKLVSLPPDLAERVEKFRESSGASSESDALKLLIEDGLKMRDKAEDLFRRCETSTSSGQSIGDIINLVTSDHPLVERTVLDNEALIVYLKGESPEQRFRYMRPNKSWYWEFHRGSNIWTDRTKKDLDDEIPF